VPERFIMVACRNDIVDRLGNTQATAEHKLLHAKDGREVFGYLELHKGEVDLVLLDLELLVGRDLDRLRDLVNQRQTRPLKIIAMELSIRSSVSEIARFARSCEPPRGKDITSYDRHRWNTK
jgi:hypothetical protein